MNKLLIVLYVALVAFYIVGCETKPPPAPQGDLVGTLRVYRTPEGSLCVVSDQTGDSMIFDMRIKSVLISKREELKND